MTNLKGNDIISVENDKGVTKMKFYVRRDMDKHCRMALTSLHDADLNRLITDVYAEYLDEMEIYEWCNHDVELSVKHTNSKIEFLLLSNETGEVLKNTTLERRYR